MLQKSGLQEYINKWPACVPVNFVYNCGLANPCSRVLIFDWILQVNQRKLLARGLLMPRGCGLGVHTSQYYNANTKGYEVSNR